MGYPVVGIVVEEDTIAGPHNSAVVVGTIVAFLGVAHLDRPDWGWLVAPLRH